MTTGARKVWVSDGIFATVCFGFDLDHLVLSPDRARAIGQSLIEAADKCVEENKKKKEPISEGD
jgi:hypothetical protein